MIIYSAKTIIRPPLEDVTGSRPCEWPSDGVERKLATKESLAIRALAKYSTAASSPGTLLFEIWKGPTRIACTERIQLENSIKHERVVVNVEITGILPVQVRCNGFVDINGKLYEFKNGDDVAVSFLPEEFRIVTTFSSSSASNRIEFGE